MQVPIATPAAVQSRVPVTKVAPLPSRGDSTRIATDYRTYGQPVERGQWQLGDLTLFANTYKHGNSRIGSYSKDGKFVTYDKSVSRGQWQTGDLILFADTYKRGILHIGLYLKDGTFVHAGSSGKRVRVDSLMTGYFASKYWGARRIK